MVKLEKEKAFIMSDDIFICFLYINPENSSYGFDIDVIEQM